MTRLLIIGATGGIGRCAVDIALARGCTVRALARGAATLGGGHHALEPVAADATDPAAVRAALDGVDAVIHAIGVAPSLSRMLKPISLFSESTRVLIAAMREAGVARLVAVTGFGAGDSRRAMSRIERTGHRMVLGTAYADKDRQEALIRDSGLDWLIVRPVILTNGRAKGHYRVLLDPADWRNGLIARADVAAFLVDQATAPTLSQVAPVLAY